MKRRAIDKSNSLTDLAVRIRQEHEASAGAIERGAQHAMNAGDLLIEAKAQLKHGQWLPWLRDHCSMSERTAQLYMRMAKARPEVEANTQHVADLSLRGAMAVIAPDEREAMLAEGEAILNRIKAADAALMDEVRAMMERLRDFAIGLYEQSPADRQAVLDTLSPEDRRLVPRWRKIKDEDIRSAQCYISCIAS
jgi:hypothetical protein